VLRSQRALEMPLPQPQLILKVHSGAEVRQVLRIVQIAGKCFIEPICCMRAPARHIAPGCERHAAAGADGSRILPLGAAPTSCAEKVRACG